MGQRAKALKSWLVDLVGGSMAMGSMILDGCAIYALFGGQARTRARQLISNWLHQNDRWTMKGWQPDIMAKRLTNLVFCYDWYGSSADEKFQGQLGKTVRLTSALYCH